jgi:uncharacterized protein (TIGR02996 family)
MSAEAGLLKAIREAPEDDTPRLVYADWLTENGQDERAEFIRLQCRLASLPEWEPERDALVEREQALLARHRREWTPELPGFALRAAHAFRRGFLSHFHLQAKELLRSAGRLFGVTPVDSLELSGVAGKVAEVAASPYLARLTALRLTDLRTEHLDTLLGSPHLVRLRSLAVEDSWIGVRGALRLSAWPGLAGLTSLSLARTDVTVAGVELVLGSRHLGRLESLNLSELINSWGKLGAALARCERLDGLRRLVFRSSAVRDDGLTDLAVAPWLGGLESLDLYWSLIGEAGIAALVRSPHLGNLRELNLNGGRPGPSGVRMLATGQWERLVRLDLGFCDMGDEGAAALAQAPCLGNLRWLNLARNKLTDEGALHLSRSPTLGRLSFLELAGNDLGYEGARALVESDRLASLSGLGLASNRRLMAEVPWLAEVPQLARLNRLSLNGLNMGPDYAPALVRSPHLRGLTHLDLGNNQVDNRVASTIARSSRFADLTELHLYVGSIDGEGVRALARSPHLTRLRVLDVTAQRYCLDGDAVEELVRSETLASLLRLRVTLDDPALLGRLRQRFGERAVNTY